MSPSRSPSPRARGAANLNANVLNGDQQDGAQEQSAGTAAWVWIAVGIGSAFGLLLLVAASWYVHSRRSSANVETMFSNDIASGNGIPGTPIATPSALAMSEVFVQEQASVCLTIEHDDVKQGNFV